VIETEKYVFVIMELVGSKQGLRGIDLFDWIMVIASLISPLQLLWSLLKSVEFLGR
jgi:hypothetical protein